MHEWISLNKSIFSDIKSIKKNYFYYTIVYFICVIFSYILNKQMNNYFRDSGISILIMIPMLFIYLFQYINSIIFQTAYTTSINKNIEYTKISTIFMHVIRIFLIQMMFILILSLIFSIIA